MHSGGAQTSPRNRASSIEKGGSSLCGAFRRCTSRSSSSVNSSSGTHVTEPRGFQRGQRTWFHRMTQNFVRGLRGSMPDIESRKTDAFGQIIERGKFIALCNGYAPRTHRFDPGLHVNVSLDDTYAHRSFPVGTCGVVLGRKRHSRYLWSVFLAGNVYVVRANMLCVLNFEGEDAGKSLDTMTRCHEKVPHHREEECT